MTSLYLCYANLHHWKNNVYKERNYQGICMTPITKELYKLFLTNKTDHSYALLKFNYQLNWNLEVCLISFSKQWNYKIEEKYSVK